MPKVEQATVEDVPALCALLAVLFSQETEFVQDSAAQARGLERILNHPDSGDILVLKNGSEILGMVNLLYTVSTALGERVAWLEDMVVLPVFRNEGGGSMLLKEAMAFARSKGCKRITLLTDGDNRAAQRFYGKHGFVLSQMVPMRRLLE